MYQVNLESKLPVCVRLVHYAVGSLGWKRAAGSTTGPRIGTQRPTIPRSDSRGPRFGELGWRGGMVRYELRDSTRTLRLIPELVPLGPIACLCCRKLRDAAIEAKAGTAPLPCRVPAVWGLEFWRWLASSKSHHMTSPSPTKCGEKVWRMMQLSSKIELAKS